MQQALAHLIQSTVQGLGYQLWGFEYRPQKESALLRIFIEADNGITVEDCATVSRQLGAALDVEDLIPVAYILEVSSPGIDRVLFVPEHFQHYLNHAIKIRTRLAVDGRKNFRGRLLSADDQSVTILVDKQEYQLDYPLIDRARLIYEDEMKFAKQAAKPSAPKKTKK
ncbi:MAG: ribosome maturation factor RimP [bacterium]